MHSKILIFNIKGAILKFIKVYFPNHVSGKFLNNMLTEAIDISKKNIEKNIDNVDFSVLIKIIGILINDVNESKFRSIIISGYPRVGKSILSEKLSNKFNGTLLKTDALRKIYWEIEDGGRRQKVRENLYNEIIKNYPHNLIVEGDDFISENRSIDSALKPYSLDLISQLKDTYDIEACVIGNKETSVNDKVSGLKEFRSEGDCWTLKNAKYKKSKNLQNLAKGTVEASKSLWYLSEKSNVIYFEIRSINFNEDISTALEKISNGINIDN